MPIQEQEPIEEQMVLNQEQETSSDYEALDRVKEQNEEVTITSILEEINRSVSSKSSSMHEETRMKLDTDRRKSER